MGMKFHTFYVAVWNTPGILVSAILAILPLLVALNSGPVIRRSGIPYISGLETGTVRGRCSVWPRRSSCSC
jgi:hypothetical protein